jgi:hypothetical protein
MAFPSSLGTAQENLNTAWDRARSFAGEVKRRAQDLRAKSAAGTMASGDVLDYTTFLADMKLEFNAIAALGSPLAAYAQAQLNDNTINIGTEFTNMVAALDNVVSWVVTNFPKTSGTNELRAQTFAPDNSGRTVDVVFSAASTSTFRTQLDALIAAIN